MERTDKDKEKRMANEECVPVPKNKTRKYNIMSALKQEIIALKDQGHTGKQISEKFDLANSSVNIL